MAALLGVGATAVACTAPEAAPDPSGTTSSTPSPSLGSPEPVTGSTLAEPNSARPATLRSFGPNGTHFPAEVPWPGNKAATELVAECDWVDIARKISGLTAAKVAAGAVVRVKPGTLPGSGYTSSARAALAGIGNSSWTRNVLIVPRDGFGSVTIAASGIRFDKCARLSFFGFTGNGGVALTECYAIHLGWSRFAAINITRRGRDLGFYELVVGFRQNAEDTVGVRPTEANEMVNISRHGCVFGPSVKPAGSNAHCDTIQLEGTGSGAFGPFTSVDCVDYGSSNAAELLQDKLVRAEYTHCMILGGQLPWRVYPLRSGDYQGEPNAFAGGCQDVRLTDSVVAGPIGRMGFTHVNNTRLSYAPQGTQQPSSSGGWITDTSVGSWTRDQIMGQQSIPDYELPTLRRIWTW
ncbi:hypothetical protein FVP77_15715 [Microbacterium hatanonis]|uniref:Right-handed parallel beta-helix repeat-containing protein n=2 Tax=Microbacterium hatanonis TaxID=404366 RepID=A0A5C8HZ22_9MICO|nr:hypothetical protein FVP77_15715 [Microbacterium hatanonis]